MIRYDVRIECLSPVHIGSGLQIDPLEYIMECDKQENKVSLIRLNRYGVTSAISNEDIELYYESIDRMDIPKLREIIERTARALYKQKRRDEARLYHVPASYDDFYKKYEQEKNNSRNQLLVDTFIRTDNERTPYIPGSSLKGALRTPVVSKAAEQFRPWSLQKNDIESKALGYDDIKNDPFRALAIADARCTNANISIESADRIHKDPSKKMKGLSNAEFLTKGTQTTTTITLHNELFKEGALSDRAFSSLEDVFEMNRAFFRERAKFDEEFFQQHGAPPDVRVNISLVLDEFDSLSNNETIVQLGRYGSFQAKTVDNHRDKGKNSGVTRNVVSDRSPAGWVKLTIEKRNPIG